MRLVIEPNFYWDFGPATPFGPGELAAIFSNCERLELSIDANVTRFCIRTAKDFQTSDIHPSSPI